MSNRITLEITQNFDIYITTLNDNVKNKKHIDIDTLIDILETSKDKAKVKTKSFNSNENSILYCSDLFPNFNNVHVLQHIIKNKNTDIYILQRQKVPTKFAYYDDVFDNVGVPSLIFALTVSHGLISKVKIMAIKDKIIKPNSLLYVYPFSNVDKSGGVCLGGNSMMDYKIDSVNELHSFPSMFFMMPSTHEIEGKNNSGMKYRPFLKSLTSNEFNDEYLIQSKFTYERWINEVVL